jgi:3-methyladenine DNA glycosylase AlkD
MTEIDLATTMARLEAAGRPDALAGMARFAIDTENALGVAVPELRKIARAIKRDHSLALALWDTGVHDARLLATMVAEPRKTTLELCDGWAGDFRSWDLCDQACMNLFRRTAFAHDLVERYRESDPEFVKRTAFAMIATLAVHDKKAGNEIFESYLPNIEEAATDPRDFVKKAVNWALRQIGKRNLTLNASAIAVAERLAGQPDKAARWNGKDALRELSKPTLRDKLSAKSW